MAFLSDDDVLIHREVLIWVIGARRQLDRWEPLVARHTALSMLKREVPGRLAWDLDIEHHLAIVACGQLRSALDAADGKIEPMPAALAGELTMLRNLHEHRDENRARFANIWKPILSHRTAKQFAAAHPLRSPFGFWTWESARGPMLGPDLPSSEVRDELDRIERDVLARDPSLAEYLPQERPRSPWLGEEPDPQWRWFPRDDL
jgi:hypothetical protein